MLPTLTEAPQTPQVLTSKTALTGFLSDRLWVGTCFPLHEALVIVI